MADDYEEDLRRLNIPQQYSLGKNEPNFQRYLLEDQDDIIMLQNSLRGIRLDPLQNRWVYIDGTQLMNEAGARVITETFLMPIKNMKLSNFDDEEIDQMLYRTFYDLNRFIYLNIPEYQIDARKIDAILRPIKNFFQSVINRARYGGEQDRLGNNQKIVTQDISQPAQHQMPIQPQQYDEHYSGGGKKWFNPFG